MTKKHLLLLLSLALFLMSCIFDSDETGLNSWLSDQGLPVNYKVETVVINDIDIESSRVYMDSTPRSGDVYTVLGRVSNLSHEVVYDMAFMDSAFFANLRSSDSASAMLSLNLIKTFYSTKEAFPKDSLPIAEEMPITVSWILSGGSNKKSYVDSLGKSDDSLWYKQLKDFEADNSADTVFSIKFSKTDSSLYLHIPDDILEDMKAMKKTCRLQLKLSAPNSARAYHFYGSQTGYVPVFRVEYKPKGESKSKIRSVVPFRVGTLFHNMESDPQALILHGGILDSLIMEIPSDKILKALSEFYGDEFPYEEGDGNDVRQAVVMAQFSFIVDDSKGSQEMARPIQVVVGSYVDSLGEEHRQMEYYKINREYVSSQGHPNMVFNGKDTLKLQVTYGMRELINRASDGRNFKMMMRMGYPVLQVKDPTYSNYITKDNDTSYVFASNFDYARYDFSSIASNPVSLKLWLATNRGDK